jgi:hypothetical protein
MPEEIRTKLAYIRGTIQHSIPEHLLPKAAEVGAAIINRLSEVASVEVELGSGPQEYSLIVPFGELYVWITIDGREVQRHNVSVKAGEKKEVNFSL